MAQKQQQPEWPFDLEKLMEGFQMPGLSMEQVMDSHRKNIEAVNEANRLAMEAMQAVGQRQAEILKKSMDEAAAMVRDLGESDSPDAQVAKQAELAKLAFERTLANIRELSEMVARSNTEAAELLSRRVAEGLEEIKTLAAK